ncbi:hypothetical protein X474_10565 [Dethiosulfatarculus sandiegensis]|uniref:Uncharacterized protein n=2 Tax=Dethiosulfatarculus sandiegensis TaxID=1429043 RepID=A0A0D2HUF6_9BACT|nr:hypothetical protein X474_10565 [Dethiosulfatarculus sandiegensis]
MKQALAKTPDERSKVIATADHPEEVKMKKIIIPLLALTLLTLAGYAWAKGPVQAPMRGSACNCCAPPRFQIFQAPKPYGGLLMVDTQTGETYQRIIVNTTNAATGGIDIRWMKIEKKGPQKNETVFWD